MASDPSEDDLRLLYLDWCSSRVARRFLELSLDEVWLLSHLPQAVIQSAAAEDGSGQEPVDALARIPGYLDLVRRTALSLAREMDLPSFADWRRSYLAAPHSFDLEIMTVSRE